MIKKLKDPGFIPMNSIFIVEEIHRLRKKANELIDLVNEQEKIIAGLKTLEKMRIMEWENQK